MGSTQDQWIHVEKAEEVPARHCVQGVRALWTGRRGEGERSGNFSTALVLYWYWIRAVAGEKRKSVWKIYINHICKGQTDTDFICSMRPGAGDGSREGQTHHNSTQAVLRILVEKSGAVGREIQLAEGVMDVSPQFLFVLALVFKPEIQFWTILSNTQTSFLHCSGCLTDFPSGRENQQTTTSILKEICRDVEDYSKLTESMLHPQETSSKKSKALASEMDTGAKSSQKSSQHCCHCVLKLWDCAAHVSSSFVPGSTPFPLWLSVQHATFKPL